MYINEEFYLNIMNLHNSLPKLQQVISNVVLYNPGYLRLSLIE